MNNKSIEKFRLHNLLIIEVTLLINQIGARTEDKFVS